MPIIGLQQQQTEVGRIRLGAPKVNDRTPGRKLSTFRFTSPRKALVDEIAARYGGTVQEWQPPKGNGQWQVITNVAEVPVLVPPQDPTNNQWYEMWSAGGCLRRCDGDREKISNGPCLCDPDARDCKMHTRLRVMLEEIPGLGAWRVDTGSYYAAVELPGVAALLAMAQGAIPGRLVLDQRIVTRKVNGQPKTLQFAVPTLHVEEITPGQLVSGKVHELVAARRAAAIEGELRAAIAAGPAPDYPLLIGAAKTVPALYELHGRAERDHGGTVPPELLALFEQRRAALLSAQPQQQPRVVDATVVDGPPALDDPDMLWAQIVEASPWDDANELERHFCEVVGRSSDEATADDMRQFLAAIEQAKAGQQ